MSFNDLTINEYTSRSVAVQGDTRKYKEDLKKMGGKYNGRLTDGPGWIFPKTKENDIREFIKMGKRLVTDEEEKEGERLSKQRAKEWSEQQKVIVKPSVPNRVNKSIVGIKPTLSEYASLVNLVKTMSTKIELLEHGMLMLLNDGQKVVLTNLMKPTEEKVKKGIVKKVVKRQIESNNNSSDSDVSSDNDSDEDIPRRRLLRQ